MTRSFLELNFNGRFSVHQFTVILLQERRKC